MPNSSVGLSLCVLCAVAVTVLAAMPPIFPVPVVPFHRNTNGTNVTDIGTFHDMMEFARSDDGVYLIYFYDAMNVNSLRCAANVEAAAALLKGFVKVAAVDVRNPRTAAHGRQLGRADCSFYPRHHAPTGTTQAARQHRVVDDVPYQTAI